MSSCPGFWGFILLNSGVIIFSFTPLTQDIGASFSTTVLTAQLTWKGVVRVRTQDVISGTIVPWVWVGVRSTPGNNYTK